MGDVTCFVCLVQQTPPGEGTAAEGALAAVALEVKVGDLCDRHRGKARELEAGARAWIEKRLRGEIVPPLVGPDGRRRLGK